MSPLDIVVLSLLAGSALWGVMRGLVREVVALGAWLLAFAATRTLAPGVAGWLPGLDSPGLRHAAAMVLVFVVVLLAAGVLGRVFSGLVKMAGLGLYDRLLGLFFGALRGVAAVVALTLLAGLTAFPQSRYWHEASARVALEWAARQAMPWLPADIVGLIKYS